MAPEKALEPGRLQKIVALEGSPETGLQFFRPDGTPIPNAPPAPPGDPDLASRHQAMGIGVDPGAIVPESFTSRVDY